MKKLTVLLLALALLLSVCSAMAENALEVELIQDGTWVAFTDYNLQICLPSDWVEQEIPAEQIEDGMLYFCTNPELTRSFTLTYSELDEATDIETVAAQLAEAYSDVIIITINEMPFITYSVPENDVNGLTTLGASGIGLYQFVFYPASDEGYGSLALQIAASISAIE